MVRGAWPLVLGGELLSGPIFRLRLLGASRKLGASAGLRREWGLNGSIALSPWDMPAVVVLPESIARELRRKAGEAGLSLDEYMAELALEGLDPRDRAELYAEAALELLEQAREELDKGDIRQASEKVWEAAALAVKAYACWREGKRLASHRELWEYKDKVAEELGGWVIEAWFAAVSMHVNFYEGWATKGDVERALGSVERLVRAAAERVLRRSA